MDERSELKKKQEEPLQTETGLEDLKRERSRLDNEISRLNNEQLAVKVLLNSLYGCMGTPYFRYFRLEIAEGITKSGQLVIKWAERALNEVVNGSLKGKPKDWVIAMDTDSCYVDCSWIKRFCRDGDELGALGRISHGALEPALRKCFDDLAKLTNAYEPAITMKREVIANRGIWTAKKRYLLNVLDSEGVIYAKPKLKMMGIEAVKSSTPQVVRKAFKKVFDVLMNGTKEQFDDMIGRFRIEFEKLPPEDVAFPRGVNNLRKFSDPDRIYVKGTPMHVRASLLYNHYAPRSYDRILSGDKMRFVYLRMPNPIRENVIAFPEVLPKELGLHGYVDYDTQFDKTFATPLEPIAKAIGWSVSGETSLNDFF